MEDGNKTELRSKPDSEEKFPKGGVFGAMGVYVLMERRLPPEKGVRRLKKFARYSLMEVDDRGDTLNYPPHSRQLAETVKNYHANINMASDKPCDVNELREKLRHELRTRGIDYAVNLDWFMANISWEHIMGGGAIDDLPEEMKKYLRITTPAGEFGVPVKDSVRGWKDLNEEEKRLAYRLSTDWWYSRAIAANVADVQEIQGWETADFSEKALTYWFITNIYQLSTDTAHKKNTGEPTWNGVVKIFKERDAGWSSQKEAQVIAKIANGPKSLAALAYVVARLVSESTDKPDWEGQLNTQPEPA